MAPPTTRTSSSGCGARPTTWPTTPQFNAYVYGPMQPRLVIVDDDREMREALGTFFSGDGHACELAENGAAALEMVGLQTFDVVIADVLMEGMTGLELLDRLRRTHPALPLIVITGKGGIHQAVDAIKRGAFQYMVKPCAGNDLRRIVTEALHNRRHPTEIPASPRSPSTVGHPEIVGSSGPMRALRAAIGFVARSSAPVVIVGETGVGKELAAAKTFTFGSTYCQCACLPFEIVARIFRHWRRTF
jgi:DNA-binding NtrC family response regulator